MNNGVLQFTLGLQMGGFLSALSTASRATNAFFGVAAGSFAGFTAGIMEGIGKGAALEKLHKQTGESVGDLYRLEKGFEAVDVAVENVGPAVLAMQRALGGTNELGENTADIFKRMSLSATELKRVGAAQQIQQITTAIGKLNSSDAAKAASMIFGRQNGASMLQIARSADDFQKAIKEAGAQAAVFERVAASFSKIDLLVASIKSNFGNFFVGIAAGLGPELEKALQKIKGFSDKLGPAIAGAVSSGHLEDLLEDALNAAFEQGAYFGARIFQALAIGFGDALTTALKIVFENMGHMASMGLANTAAILAANYQILDDKSAIADLEAQKYNHANGHYELGDTGDDKISSEMDRYKADIGIQQGTISALGDQMARATITDIHDGVGNMMQGINDGIKDIVNSWKNSDDPNHPHAAMDKFKGDLNTYAAPPGIDGLLNLIHQMGDAAGKIPLVGKMLQGEATSAESLIKTFWGNLNQKNNPDKTTDLARTSYTYKPEFNVFEKMGFVMRGGSANPATEYARATRDGVLRLCGLQETTIQLLESADTGNFHSNSP
jgi:hypothetical protein